MENLKGAVFLNLNNGVVKFHLNQYFECTIEKATNELKDELRAKFLDFCLFLKKNYFDDTGLFFCGKYSNYSWLILDKKNEFTNNSIERECVNNNHKLSLIS